MKTLIPFLFLFIFTNSFYAQEVISSFGSSSSGGATAIESTVGEVSIATLSNANNKITQGFHQSNLTVLAVEDLDLDILVRVYPNPSIDIFNIELKDYTDTSYKIFNINGQLVKENTLNVQNNEIKVDYLSNGMYFLALFKNNQRIKTYKILKN